MTAIAYYLVKVIICSGILFLYYHLALKNKMFHQWNRFYLLAAVILSLLLPIIQFTVWHSPEQETKAIDIIMLVQSADIYLEEITVTASPSVTPEQWVSLLYFLACFLLLISFFVSVLRIRKIIKAHTVQRFGDVKFINTTEPGSPFSFLRYIFWNEKISLQTEVGQQIFQHELVHVKERHTHDKLFLQIVLVFFWCNPFFWLIRRELKHIHEFIADKKAVAQHGTEAFAAMILQAAYPQHYHSITNQFFQTSIKRRLLMLTKIQNPRLAYISRIVALPLVALTIFAFTVRAKSLANAEENTPNDNPGMSSLSVVQDVENQKDTIPKSKKVISTIDVRKKEDKKINEIIITYNDGSSETLSEADAMQKGIIHPDYGNQKTRELSSVSGSLRLKSDGQNPVYFLDGKEINTAVLSEIDPKGIESINVLKGPAAINKYGEAGKNGIVEIKMKKAASAELMTIQEDGRPVMQGQMDKLQLKGDNEMNFRGTIRLIRDTVTGRENRIFLKAEFPPSVDIMEWRRFLEKNLTTIIEEAATKGIEPGNYVVQVRFIVETDGSLSDVRVITHPGYGIDKKILEIMQGSPTWKPAIQNGRAVRCYHTQPITFVVSDGDKVEPTTLQKNTDPAKIKSFSLHKLAGVPQSEEIVSCVFSMDSDKGDIKVVTNKGNKLTSATKNLLASAKSGKTLIVEKIFVRRNGHQQEMPSQVYKM